MLNESALKDTLVTLARTCKASAQSVVTLQIEMGTLTETVRALNPAFSETLESKKKEVVDPILPNFEAVVQTFDMIIDALESGEVC